RTCQVEDVVGVLEQGAGARGLRGIARVHEEEQGRSFAEEVEDLASREIAIEQDQSALVRIVFVEICVTAEVHDMIGLGSGRLKDAVESRVTARKQAQIDVIAERCEY